jgi:hypothetical protein
MKFSIAVSVDEYKSENTIKYTREWHGATWRQFIHKYCKYYYVNTSWSTCSSNIPEGDVVRVLIDRYGPLYYTENSVYQFREAPIEEQLLYTEKVNFYNGLYYVEPKLEWLLDNYVYIYFILKTRGSCRDHYTLIIHWIWDIYPY